MSDNFINNILDNRMINCSISIVIPAYNVEKYLGEALDSIQEQSEYPDELILIDDGSMDQTLAIANSYDFSFPYKVVSIENSGQGNARNIGVDLSTSEYIYYFDSDDIIDKSFIKTIKKQIADSNFPDIVLFSGESFNDNNYYGKRWLDYTRGFSGFFNNRIDFLNEGFLKAGLFCQPCLYVSKKSLWGKQGLKFRNGYLEDEAIFYPLIFSCQSFYVLDEVFFYRRNRNGSTMTMKPNSKHVKGALNCIETSLELYQSRDFSKPEKWHIKKRIEKYCISYISIARRAELKVSYDKIFDAAYITQNIKLLAKIPFYMAKVNEINVVKKARQVVKTYL